MFLWGAGKTPEYKLRLTLSTILTFYQTFGQIFIQFYPNQAPEQQI